MTRTLAAWLTLGACLVIAAGSAYGGWRASDAHWQGKVIEWQARVAQLEAEKNTAAAELADRTEQLRADLAQFVERLRGTAIIVLPDEQCRSLPKEWGDLWDAQ